jgi:Transposase DDE domain
MPYKHNQSRRHKIENARYKVTNWPEYNQALRQRGDVTIWFTEEALAAWRPTKTGARGRPQEYSDLAIETALFLRQVFHLPLRQTEGFMNSLSRLMKSVISIPDYSSISKRSISLPRQVLSQALEPGSLVIVDSTGLKVYDKDEWHQEKHDVPARRTWRKLHLAIDEHHQVIACEFTTPEVGDPAAVADLLAAQNGRSQLLATRSETIILRSLHNKGGSLGSASRATTCATMPSLQCNATSAFSATP